MALLIILFAYASSVSPKSAASVKNVSHADEAVDHAPSKPVVQFSVAPNAVLNALANLTTALCAASCPATLAISSELVTVLTTISLT